MDEYQKELEQYEEMFQTEGWKNLIKTGTIQHENIMGCAVAAAQTNDQWQFLRGQITQLDQLLGFEGYVIQTLKQLDEPDQDNDENTLEL